MKVAPALWMPNLLRWNKMTNTILNWVLKQRRIIWPLGIEATSYLQVGGLSFPLTLNYCLNWLFSWVKVFRIIPEFRILRLTFHRKSASKCWIEQIIIAFLICYQKTIDHFNLKKLLTLCLNKASFKFWISKVQDFFSFELSPMYFNFFNFQRKTVYMESSKNGRCILLLWKVIQKIR